MDYTIKEFQVSEYLKCKNSFEYYAMNYVYIEIPGGDQKFNLYKKQKELVHDLILYKFILCLKSRQTGISTTIQAYCSWLVNFNDNVVIGIISKDASEATSFAKSIRGMIEKLPTWMKPPKGSAGAGFRKSTEQTFELTNGSKVISSTVNPNEPSKTLRGKPITFLVIDEAAFIGKLDDAWTSMVPALSTSQKHARLANVPYGVAVISTPNKTVGIGKWFYSKYTNALALNAGESTATGMFRPFIIYWKDIEELANDPEWYRNQCVMFDNDERKIKQELELIFLPTSGSFFDEKTCFELQEGTKDNQPKQIIKLFNGEAWVFEDPTPGKYYLIGVDTASEYGRDKSAITIWDYETLDQVWEYQGKLPVTDFCKVVEFACASYSGTIIPEANSMGNQVAEYIDRSPYMMMLYKNTKGNIIKRGIYTDVKTRPLMIDALYTYVSQYPQMVKSKRTALELIGLTQKNSGKVEADEDCNDDLAISLAFCSYVRKYDPPLNVQFNSNVSTDFERIIGMNYGESTLTEDNYKNMSVLNTKIFKEAKKRVTSNSQDTFVDTFKILRG